jgi:hypothetical protein
MTAGYLQFQLHREKHKIQIYLNFLLKLNIMQKFIPFQAWAGPEGTKGLRFSEFIYIYQMKIVR